MIAFHPDGGNETGEHEGRPLQRLDAAGPGWNGCVATTLSWHSKNAAVTISGGNNG